MSSNFGVSTPPQFNGDNYQFWVVKMQSYLKALGLWESILNDVDPPPLGANPTLNQIRQYEEEKSKKPKALSCIHATLSDPIFARIINCDTAKKAWYKLKEEFEGSTKVKAVKLITLKREFEMLKMKDSDIVKEYTTKVMTIVNQIRLAGEDFPDQRVMKKIMVSVPDRFESKISAIEESCDLTTLSIAELISKLQVQKQRDAIRNEEHVEGAFNAKFKGKKHVARDDRKATEDQGSQGKGVSRRGNFPPCHFCKKTNHAEENCWYKNKQVYHCDYCDKNGHTENFCHAKQNQSSQQPSQQANRADDQKQETAFLFMASHVVETNINSWLIDNGYTTHMAKNISLFNQIDKSVRTKVALGHGETVLAEGKGNVIMHTK